jgi:hypothetical protein
MKEVFRLFAVTAPLALVAVAAGAQESDRYQLEKSADGYVRLDKQTGEMSICTEKSGQLVCRTAADDRTALHDQVMQLEGRVASLEQQLAKAEKDGLAGSGMPTDEEFEKTMGYMEKFFRRFMGVVKNLNEDPQPNKT